MKTNPHFSRGLPSARHLKNPMVRRSNRSRREQNLLVKAALMAKQSLLQDLANEQQKRRTVPKLVKLRLWFKHNVFGRTKNLVTSLRWKFARKPATIAAKETA